MEGARRWLRVPGIAARYELSVHTIYKLVQKGAIPYGRISRVLVFDTEACDQCFAARGGSGGSNAPPNDAQTRQQQAESIAGRILNEV